MGGLHHTVPIPRVLSRSRGWAGAVGCGGLIPQVPRAELAQLGWGDKELGRLRPVSAVGSQGPCNGLGGPAWQVGWGVWGRGTRDSRVLSPGSRPTAHVLALAAPEPAGSVRGGGAPRRLHRGKSERGRRRGCCRPAGSRFRRPGGRLYRVTRSTSPAPIPLGRQSGAAADGVPAERGCRARRCPRAPGGGNGPSRAGGPIPLHNSGRTKAAVLSPRARSPANRHGGNISASARRPPPHPFWAIKKVQLPARPDNAAALPLELGNAGGCRIRPQPWHRARRPEGGMGGQRAPCSPAGGWRASRVEPVSPAGSGDGYLGQCPKRSRRDGKSPLAAA